MALGTATELIARTHKAGEDTSRQYVRRFQVLSNIVDEDPLDVRFAIGVPRMYDFYPTDLGAFVVNLDIDQDNDNPYRWEITASYSTKTGDGRKDPGQRNENPLLRPVEIDIDFEPYTRAVEYDLDGVRICNSAGDVFDPPVEIDDMRPVLTLVRNQPSFNLLQAEEYQDAINSDTFLNFEPETLKVRLKARREYENGIFYFRVTASIHIRRKFDDPQTGETRGGWVLRKLDEGFHFLDDDGFRHRIKVNGEDPATPVPLDGDGLVQPPGEDPVYLEFAVYKKLPFANLSLL